MLIYNMTSALYIELKLPANKKKLIAVICCLLKFILCAIKTQKFELCFGRHCKKPNVCTIFTCCIYIYVPISVLYMMTITAK